MIWLASQSPRRRTLLAQLGVPFRVVNVAVPEVPGAAEPARAYVERAAVAKAQAGWMVSGPRDLGCTVLAADTEVVLAGRIFGKPRDDVDAAAMLRALAGCTHVVLSAVCCINARGERVAACESQVTFADLDADAIAQYVSTGEPHGKAGGYAIQGRAAAFVRNLTGSYSGVVGLPLYETSRLLHDAGAWP